MGQLDEILGLVGLAFVIFLVLAAAVEAILEVVRGFTGKFLPQLKGAVSLDDALAQAQQFAPANGELQARLNALKAAADKIKLNISEDLTHASAAVNTALTAVPAATSEAERLLGIQHMTTVTDALNGLADKVSTEISDYERRRILVLRLVSALLGVAIAISAKVDVFELLAKSGGIGASFATVAGLPGQIITGIAAASGSSYWHDQLDKVRSLKNLNQQAAAIIK